METLTLNNGDVLNGHILENGDGQLIFVYLDGLNIVQGFALFSVTSNIERIVANNHGEEHVYEGFTDLTSISTEFGNCNIILKRAVI